METYHVTIDIERHINTDVQADSPEEAMNIAYTENIKECPNADAVTIQTEGKTFSKDDVFTDFSIDMIGRLFMDATSGIGFFRFNSKTISQMYKAISNKVAFNTKLCKTSDPKYLVGVSSSDKKTITVELFDLKTLQKHTLPVQYVASGETVVIIEEAVSKLWLNIKSQEAV